MKTIKVTITPDGKTTVEAVGFKGQGCKAATKPIEEALGQVESTQQKPEAMLRETNPNQASNSYGW